MASVSTPVLQGDMSIPATGPVATSETRPRDVDTISVDSAESILDFTGRRLVTFDDGRINTAYEAWELVFIKDRHTHESWKSFCGINFGTRRVNRNDGCVLTNAIDLANRVYSLPDEAYDKLQLLLEDRTISTNRNPYRNREWRVMILQPSEFRMTELLPERKQKNLFSRKKQALGWKAYNRGSDLWWRLDNLETKEKRNQHKEMAKKMDRARVYDRHYSPHRPRPASPSVPRHLPPLGPR
ncbi:hypothetical protein F5X98DRAFT_364261 [Xylaria grammica]|nr:hypothetical protein F5X98DRAFT_364261 [Xylaria grammica]